MERHQTLAAQRHMDVLDLREAQIAALADGARRISSRMTADRDCRSTVGLYGVGIKVGDHVRQAGFGAAVAAFLPRREVAGQGVHGLDRRNTMALPHDPGTGCA